MFHIYHLLLLLTLKVVGSVVHFLTILSDLQRMENPELTTVVTPFISYLLMLFACFQMIGKTLLLFASIP